MVNKKSYVKYKQLNVVDSMNLQWHIDQGWELIESFEEDVLIEHRDPYIAEVKDEHNSYTPIKWVKCDEYGKEKISRSILRVRKFVVGRTELGKTLYDKNQRTY